MAGIELRNGRYNIIVRFGGKRFVRSLKTNDHDAALSRKLRVEENISLIESGRLQLPAGADLMTFLLSDGKLNKKPVAKASLSLSALFTEFFDRLPAGTLEETSIATMKIHQSHLERILGKRFVVQDLSQDDLQRYVTKRSKQRTRNGTVAGTTIKKEIVTLGTVWKWGVGSGQLRGGFPNQNLKMPKAKEAPVFQTRDQIKRQIAGGSSPCRQRLEIVEGSLGRDCSCLLVLRFRRLADDSTVKRNAVQLDREPACLVLPAGTNSIPEG